MNAESAWIERGSDGHHYFVRPKSHSTSKPKLVSNIIAGVRNSPISISRSLRDILSAPDIGTRNLFQSLTKYQPPSNQETFDPSSQKKSNVRKRRSPAKMNNLVPRESSRHKTSAIDDDTPREAARNEPQRYPAPHPSMIPVAPAPSAPFLNFTSGLPPQPRLPYPTHPVPPFPFQKITHPAPPLPTQTFSGFPAQPTGTLPSLPMRVRGTQPMPPGAMFAIPPQITSMGNLRYKCGICGRERSRRYHKKNPIPFGHVPGPNVCKKCIRSNAHRNDIYGDVREAQQNSRARPRSNERVVYDRSRRRSQLPDRGMYHDSNSDDSIDVEREWRPARSMSGQPDQSRPARYTRTQPRENTWENPYHSRIPKHNQRQHRVVFIDDGNLELSRDYDGNYDDSEVNSHSYKSPNRHPRKHTSMAPAYTDSSSSPRRRHSIAKEVRARSHSLEYDHQKDYRPSRDRQRHRSRSSSIEENLTTLPRRQYQTYKASSESEESNERKNNPSCPRSRSMLSTSHVDSRNRSRRRSLDDETSSDIALHHAPSPPILTNMSSLAYISSDGQIDNMRCDQGQRIRLESRQYPDRNSRGRSLSVSDLHGVSQKLLPGDTITIIERHAPKHKQEFDWYEHDKRGTRGHVREI